MADPRTSVDALIRRAADHPLGTDFLRDGALDSVAAIFQVHAFTVDAARERLHNGHAHLVPSGSHSTAHSA